MNLTLFDQLSTKKKLLVQMILILYKDEGINSTGSYEFILKFNLKNDKWTLLLDDDNLTFRGYRSKGFLVLKF